MIAKIRRILYRELKYTLIYQLCKAKAVEGVIKEKDYTPNQKCIMFEGLLHYIHPE